MQERSFRPDLTGSDESLEDLLARLKSLRPKARAGRYPPPDSEHFVTSKRPLSGSGGAEAPLPVEPPAQDCYAI